MGERERERERESTSRFVVRERVLYSGSDNQLSPITVLHFANDIIFDVLSEGLFQDGLTSKDFPNVSRQQCDQMSE